MSPRHGYLHPFACFHCRRSFNRGNGTDVRERPCPICGGPAVRLGRKFKPPPRDDRGQWAKVEYLVAHGYCFQSLYDPDGNAIPYPSTLDQAEEFVKQHGRRDDLQGDA